MSDLTMSKATREAFLADVHVGVLCASRPGAAPLASPVWYLYEPGGDVRVVVGRTSQKAELVAAAGVASFCVQSEALPYRFVTVEGPVVIEEGAADIAFAMAARYLGDELAKGYVASTADHDSVIVRITPTRWRTNDYSNWTPEG
ncbi:MAG TPA: pyridoxamine 5'-phosphate oxidase family protein [Acidimicrobiales bacterium]|nr:pyridoxamine 5'-phosphate oxidase family protein [Acidimicrobiales bacterium]